MRRAGGALGALAATIFVGVAGVVPVIGVIGVVGVIGAGSVARAAEFHYLVAGAVAKASCGMAPAGWEQPGFDDASLWPTDGGTPPGCEVLRIRRRFDVGPELASLSALTLELRYQDGFVAWLNGVEVARRRYVGPAPDRGPRIEAGEVVATEAHGGDAERFYIPVRAGMLRSAGNVLAVEVHSAHAGRLAQADVALEGADALRIVRGPQIIRDLDGEATIVVESDLAARAEIRWGLSGDRASERVATDDNLATVHSFHLSRLGAGRTFHYRIGLRGEGSPSPVEVAADFHTPPGPGHPLRFVVLGDVRSGHDVHAQLVKALVEEDPDLVLMTGDLVDVGSDEAQWQRYFQIEAPLLRQVPVYPAPGNHDQYRKDVGRSRFLSLFGRPEGPTWWSFDAAGAHFVLLDSEAFKNPEQLAWLKADLLGAKRKSPRAIFACMHHGPWSSGVHGDNTLAIRDYVPVFEAAGVTVVFGGHDHHYERGRVGKLDYVVSGGGGAELRVQRCGLPGRRPCPPRVRIFANEHHYVVVELGRDHVKICPKRPDGTPIEACQLLPLRK